MNSDRANTARHMGTSDNWGKGAYGKNLGYDAKIQPTEQELAEAARMRELGGGTPLPPCLQAIRDTLQKEAAEKKNKPVDPVEAARIRLSLL